MKRIYQVVYYKEEKTNDMSDFDKKFIDEIFMNDLTFLYKYDGNMCH